MKKFVLLGENIAYSLSPKIHSLIYEHMGIKADYGLLSATKAELPFKIDYLRPLEGFNVTQPHKNDIVSYLDANKSEFSAVNTVKNENGKLTGYNTDGFGFLTHIKENYPDIKGKTVLVLGAGGMAEVAAKVLIKEGASVYILNRTFSKAEELAFASGAKAVKSAEKTAPHIIVNCSSQGLHDDDFCLPGFDASLLEFAYDTIYFETPFSKILKSKNVRTVSGLKMLIYQAIRADEIFFDTEVKDKEKLCRHIEKALNA